jgi:hypothetical protein
MAANPGLYIILVFSVNQARPILILNEIKDVVFLIPQRKMFL